MILIIDYIDIMETHAISITKTRHQETMIAEELDKERDINI